MGEGVLTGWSLTSRGYFGGVPSLCHNSRVCTPPKPYMENRMRLERGKSTVTIFYKQTKRDPPQLARAYGGSLEKRKVAPRAPEIRGVGCL